MYAAPEHDRKRIDGVAAFAAAAFLTGMGLAAALARVGAPDRLVETLGPLIALFGLAIIGAATRTARLVDFLAARRAVPAPYGGLAFAATAAGFVLALDGGATGRSPLPTPALALGLVGAALVVGPLVRRAKASALSDVLATRFPAAPARWVLSLALWSVGALIATAGFGAAVDILVAHVGASRRAAEIVVALSLATSIVPGGLKGLLWSDAASAGGALAIAAIGAALAWSGVGAPAASFAETAAAGLALPRIDADPASLLFDAATALSVGALFAFVPAAIGATPRRATRAGFYGLAFALAGLALGAIGLAAFGLGAGTAAGSPTAGAFIGAALWLPALALARGGVVGAARADGLDLRTAHARLTVLASRRLALSRLTMLLVIVLAALVCDLGLVDPPTALILALALNIALIAPALVLAAISRGSSLTAFAALATGLAVLASRYIEAGLPATPRDILIDALITGAIALLAGGFVSLVTPRAGRGRIERALPDPFVDLPFEATE